jgi:geranylgeranyl pyrophosphate synthase
MLAMKTGELFALSCELGAFLSGIRGEQREALRDYGMALGTAYQLYDDCVDLFGSERSAGKSLGTDLAKGKLTLPVILGLARSSDVDIALGSRPAATAAGTAGAVRHLRRHPGGVASVPGRWATKS